MGALLALLATGVSVHAESAPGEYEMKAALLFNFAKFVEWPATAFPAADAPFIVGVLGGDPFGSSLVRLLAHKTIGGRPIEIRRWRKYREREACQILFVAASEQGDLKYLLKDVDQQPILTVADMPGFASQGGMIGLVVEDRRVRFEINPGGADRAHLKVSSRLLSLARIVPTTH